MPWQKSCSIAQQRWALLLVAGVGVLVLGIVQPQLARGHSAHSAPSLERSTTSASVSEASSGANAKADLDARAWPPERGKVACNISESVAALHRLRHGDLDRSYRLYVPAAVCKNADRPGRQNGVPLLVFLHCFGCPCSEDDAQWPHGGWTRQAQDRGFILVRPCGDVANGPPSWNAGPCCGGYFLDTSRDRGGEGEIGRERDRDRTRERASE